MSTEITKYSVGFAFYEDFVVLIWKQRPAFQKGFLNGVGGEIEQGEDAIRAMAREFEEETGVHTTDDQWIHIGKLANPALHKLANINVEVNVCVGFLRALQFLYLCQKAKSWAGNKETDEVIEIIDIKNDAFDFYQQKKFLYNVFDLIIETHKVYNETVKRRHDDSYWSKHQHVSMIEKV